MLALRPVAGVMTLSLALVAFFVAHGLGMLVHQAARAVELWTGHRPDPVAMRSAALTELATRS